MMLIVVLVVALSAVLLVIAFEGVLRAERGRSLEIDLRVRDAKATVVPTAPKPRAAATAEASPPATRRPR